MKINHCKTFLFLVVSEKRVLNGKRVACLWPRERGAWAELAERFASPASVEKSLPSSSSETPPGHTWADAAGTFKRSWSLHMELRNYGSISKQTAQFKRLVKAQLKFGGSEGWSSGCALSLAVSRTAFSKRNRGLQKEAFAVLPGMATELRSRSEHNARFHRFSLSTNITVFEACSPSECFQSYI